VKLFQLPSIQLHTERELESWKWSKTLSRMLQECTPI